MIMHNFLGQNHVMHYEIYDCNGTCGSVCASPSMSGTLSLDVLLSFHLMAALWVGSNLNPSANYRAGNEQQQQRADQRR
jgi:hypothetical protein